ncbi:MAG: hypothetical protein V7K62_14710 [Nostoc sp.]
MKITSKPSFKELILGIIVVISLSGLLGLSFVDEHSKLVFFNIATFIIGAVVGFFIPGQK